MRGGGFISHSRVRGSGYIKERNVIGACNTVKGVERQRVRKQCVLADWHAVLCCAMLCGCAVQVVPVEFPQLLPLCGLDALCISSIATNLMQDFDAGGGVWGSRGGVSLSPLGFGGKVSLSVWRRGRGCIPHASQQT